MNQFIDQIKFFLIATLLFATVDSFSQNVLNVSGQVLFEDGSPAVEAGLFLILENQYIDDFTSTDANGNYSFSPELGQNFENGCFSILLIDCDGVYLDYLDCYTQDNTVFVKDFLFCEYGTTSCESFIFLTPNNNNKELVLSTINIGVGPFTYLWSNGSQESTVTVPITSEGTYCVTVTDSQNCISEDCIYLAPIDPCFVFISEEDGFESVTLEAHGFGQTEEIDYQWSTNEEGPEIQITESGEYCVTMTDQLGCLSYDCLYAEVDSSEWLDCYATITENITVDGSESYLLAEAYGEGPFVYEWSFSNIVVGSSDVIYPEIDGFYCVTITDTTSCSYTTCYDYYSPNNCSVYINCLHEGSKELIATATGVLPINYLWSNGEVGSSIIIEKSGEYCVSIVDAVGCESEYCYNVTLDSIDICDGSIVTEFINQTAAILSTITTEGEVTPNASYLWNTEEVTPSITVYKAGLYCVTVTLENECTFNACTYFTESGQVFNNGVVISYTDSNLQEGLNAEIELYKVEDDHIYLYYILQEWSIPNVHGLFYLENIEDGTYIARAIPENSEEYIPSYNTMSPFWDESDQFTIINGGSGLDDLIAINTIPINGIFGKGEIGGYAGEYEFNENILLFHDSEVVGQQYTDLSGFFGFESLPFGTYTLVRERPGLDRMELQVTISEDDPVIYDLSFDDISMVTNNINDLDIKTFPNPTSNYINITSELFSKNKPIVTLIDVSGKEVAGYSNLHLEGLEFSLDITNVAKGVYFLRIEVGHRREIKRIIKI